MEKPYGKLVPPPKFTKADLTRVREIYLFGTKITNSGLKELAKMQSLIAIALIGTKVTRAGVDELKKALPKCTIIGP